MCLVYTGVSANSGRATVSAEGDVVELRWEARRLALVSSAIHASHFTHPRTEYHNNILMYSYLQ